MTQRREVIDYWRDMLMAVENVEKFVKGMDFQKFSGDEKTTFAVIRALEIIGEAARNIPIAAQRRYLQIPWQKIIGMRNIVIHNYFGVDLRVIWRTSQEDTPALKPLLAQAIAEATGK